MKQNKRGSRKLAGVALAVLAVVVVSAYLLYRYVSMAYDGEDSRVCVSSGDGTDALRDSLVSSLGDEYGKRVFSLWNRMGGEENFRSGSYLVRHGEPAWKLARRIKNRRQDPVKVTFNNIRTFEDLSRNIASGMEFSAEEFKSAADSLLSCRGVGKEQYASFFFPDTYEFYWTDSPAVVVEKILSNHDKFWNETRCRQASSMGLSPEQVSTLASIVEEETNKADERPKVARLYLNRLNKGMKLQADPTVKFAVGDFSIKRILSAHLQVRSPYNTYLNYGLPPGPIRIPSAATLDAVLNAPAHDYIYMCAREDFSGYHNFASDYADHRANARRYQAALDARGIVR